VRVGQRLFLAVTPAILGLLLVVALAYWGERFRAAPEWVVVVAAVAAVASLALGWQNTRYVARRIERIAGQPKRAPGKGLSPLGRVRNVALPRAGLDPDEIDSIEAVVDRLAGAVTVAEETSRRTEAEAAERVQEYAALLAEAVSAVSRQLDEIRLPLHILLENHFGALNENQEEMLAAARIASDAANLELERLKAIADLDRGALRLRHQQLAISSLLNALRPLLESDADRHQVRLKLDIEPGLPRVAGDRVRLQEALELLLRHYLRHAPPGAQVTVTAARASGDIRVVIAHGHVPTLTPDLAFARRVILAHAGTLDQGENETVLALPGVNPKPAGPRPA